MPEEMMLPGIDTTPAPAPAAEPAAPAAEQDDSSTHSASVETSGEPAPGDAPAEDTPEQVAAKAEKRSRGGFQNRINELTAANRETQRSNAQLQSLLEMVIKGTLSPQQGAAQANAQGGQGEQPPHESQFTDWKDYERAMIRYESRQEIRKELAQRAAQENSLRQQHETQTRAQARAQAEEHLHAATGTQMQEAASRYPDFQEVIESCPVNIPIPVEAAMAITGNAGDVAYYLARNPRVIQQLSQMPDVAVAHHITRISNAMRANAANVSNAPAPGRPVGNRGTVVNSYPKDATPEQHLAWEAAMKRSQKRA